MPLATNVQKDDGGERMHQLPGRDFLLMSRAIG